MKEYPPVSIFIVTYLSSEERGEVLRKTCESVLAQRYSDFEVVVSENPGPVRAADALASIKDPRLKVFRAEENTGFAGNMNRCVELCSHEIIKPLCDDDLMHPDFLTQTVPFIDDETLVVVGVQKFEFGTEPEGMREMLKHPPESGRRTTGYSKEIWRLPYAPCSIPSATLFTRSLFESLGRYDRRTITADWDFFIESCLHRNVVHVDKPLCFVGVWSGSLTEEMMEKPFFYPTQGLYTKFRVFHHKKLPFLQKAQLMGSLLKEFCWQSLRPLRRISMKAYRSGYCEYAGCFFKLLATGKKATSERPNRI